MNLADKTAVLIGASGGIGHAIAMKLEDKGTRLILVARNKTRLLQLLKNLTGNQHAAVALDISTGEGRRQLLSQCADICPNGINLLINSAGINTFEFIERQSAASIEALININLLTPILICQNLLPLLQQQDKSRIINIGSIYGSIGHPGFSTYCASKFGLRGFTESLRRELADSGTQVSYVAPRATSTDFNCDNVVALNKALGTVSDSPSLVANEVMRVICSSGRADKYIGWPEKLFVGINALFPGLIDSGLRKQLPIIRRLASNKS